MADFAANLYAGFDAGRKRAIDQRDMQRSEQINALLGQAYADPNLRQQALADISRIDPGVAFKAEEAFSGQGDRLTAQRANMSRNYLAMPAAARGKFAQQYAQDFQRLGLDAADPDFEGIATGYAQAGVAPVEQPSVVRAFEALQKAAGNAPGSPAYVQAANIYAKLLPAAQAASYGFVDEYDPVTGGTYRRQVQTGGFERYGNGTPQPQPSPQPAPPSSPPGNLQPDSIGLMIAKLEETEGPLPEEVKASLRAQMAQDGTFTVGNRSGGQPAAPPRQTIADVPMNQLGGGDAGPGGRYQSAPTTEQAIERRRLEGAVDAETAGLKKEGELAAERQAAAPKKIAGYEAALNSSAGVVSEIDDALNLVGPMSTGYLGARVRGVEGSPSYDLAAKIETIKGNLGFAELQKMRDNSPTGGALGAIAVQELIALQSTVSNLDPNQSESQIRAGLEKVKLHYANWQKALRKSIEAERQFGQPAQPAAPATNEWGIEKL